MIRTVLSDGEAHGSGLRRGSMFAYRYISTARVATNSGIFWWVEEEEEEEEGAPPLCDQGAVSDRTALFL